MIANYKKRYNLITIIIVISFLSVSIFSLFHLTQSSNAPVAKDSVMEIYTLESKKAVIVGKDIPPGKYNIKISHNQSITISKNSESNSNNDIKKLLDDHSNTDSIHVNLDKTNSGEYTLSVGNTITLNGDKSLAIEKVD